MPNPGGHNATGEPWDMSRPQVLEMGARKRSALLRIAHSHKASTLRAKRGSPMIPASAAVPLYPPESAER